MEDAFDQCDFKREMRVRRVSNFVVDLAEETSEPGYLAEFETSRQLFGAVVGVGRTAGSLVQQYAEVGDELSIELTRVLTSFDRGVDRAKRGRHITVRQCGGK
jgi:hypothetical protein